VWLHFAHKKRKESVVGWLDVSRIELEEKTHTRSNARRDAVCTHSVMKLNENANEEQQHSFMVWPFCERDYEQRPISEKISSFNRRRISEREV
jgi:hypothetical protein